MARTGRPTKLTPELQEEVCKTLRWGVYVITAIAIAGISERTYRSWRAKGRKAKSGKYFDFLHAIKRAENDAEADSVFNIRKHAKRSWQAHAWLIERKNPARWTRRDPNANTVPLITVVEFTSRIVLAINKTVKNNEERLALTAEIERLSDDVKQARKTFRRNGTIDGNGNGGNKNGKH